VVERDDVDVECIKRLPDPRESRTMRERVRRPTAYSALAVTYETRVYEVRAYRRDVGGCVPRTRPVLHPRQSRREGRAVYRDVTAWLRWERVS
jgi:hypothetical protein